jgi:hypothetical protein
MKAVNRQNSLKAEVLIPVEARTVFFAITSRPELGPTKSPIQWIPGRLPPGVKQTERAIKKQMHISPRLRTREATPTLPSLRQGVVFIEALQQLYLVSCTVILNTLNNISLCHYTA